MLGILKKTAFLIITCICASRRRSLSKDHDKGRFYAHCSSLGTRDILVFEGFYYVIWYVFSNLNT